MIMMSLSQLAVDTYKFQETHDFSKFYGLTMEELKEVLSRKDVSMKSNYDEIIRNYNGYRGDMLNIWSVMHYLNDKGEREDKNYWKQSGVVANLHDTLKLPAIRACITKLLSGISNEIEIDYLSKIEYIHIQNLKGILDGKELNISNESVFFNFLLEQSYLKRSDLNLSEKKIILQIPNLEIKSEFHEKLLLFYSGSDFNLDLTKVRECTSLFDKFTYSDKDNEELLKEIKRLLNGIFSKISLNVQNEAMLHHIIFIIIFFSSNFRCFSEIRVAVKDNKRLDLILLNPISGIGIIIELKYGKTAEEGLEQIIRNKYFNAFENVTYNPDKVVIKYSLYVGLNMSVKKEITLCALLNCKTLENRFNC